MANEIIINKTIQNITSGAIQSAQQTRIFSWIPNWIIFLIIIAIALITYQFLSDDLKYSTKNFIKKYGVYILLVILWIYFRKRWGLISEYPDRWPGDMYRASFYALFILIFYQLGKWFMYVERYYSRAFICNGVHGSCVRYHEIGDWVIFFIGTAGSSTEKLALPWPIPKKLVVVPRVAVEFRGDDIIAHSQVFHADLIDLPSEVAHFIETDIFAKLKKDEIYFGLWDEKTRAKNLKYDEIEDKYKKVNARINELDKMLKGKLTSMKVFVSDTFAMTDKIRGKDWRRKKSEVEEE